jgi:hypothetical protein
MSLCRWAEEDWNLLLYAIRKEKCILMLGPETALVDMDGQSQPLSQILANQLIQDMEPRFKENIDPTNLMEAAQYYCPQPGHGKTELQLKIRDFYTRHQPVVLCLALFSFMKICYNDFNRYKRSRLLWSKQICKR